MSTFGLSQRQSGLSVKEKSTIIEWNERSDNDEVSVFDFSIGGRIIFVFMRVAPPFLVPPILFIVNPQIPRSNPYFSVMKPVR